MTSIQSEIIKACKKKSRKYDQGEKSINRNKFKNDTMIELVNNVIKKYIS